VGPPLSGYLRKPVYYALEDRVERGSFIEYDAEHMVMANPEAVLGQIARFAGSRGSDVFVITNDWQSDRLGALQAHFDRHLEVDEQSVDIYLFRPANLHP
jgi:hypothetical protein